tara:strand:- start:83 stop:322 length:240 start_codon:yes stop_codon:yes gene_type:complete
MHFINTAKTFNCVDAPSVSTASWNQAGTDGLPIHKHRASPTLAIATTDLGAAQSQTVAQNRNQWHPWVCLNFKSLPVCL